MLSLPKHVFCLDYTFVFGLLSLAFYLYNNCLSLIMRLSEYEIESIKSVAMRHFGSEVQVFLFGSRTKNNEHGGDIDLFIRNPKNGHLKIRNKIKFITDLIQLIGEQKIDVVLDNPDLKNSLFLGTINRMGIQLC